MRPAAVAAGLLAVSWIVAIAAFALGIAWDSKLWYVPPVASVFASMLGFMAAAGESDGRGAAVVVALAALGSALLFALAYVFLVFGLV